MSIEKFHYFLTYATFINGTTGEMCNTKIAQGYQFKVINKSAMALIASQIELHINTLDPSAAPHDIDIKSISYLGEMTEAEYNS